MSYEIIYECRLCRTRHYFKSSYENLPMTARYAISNGVQMSLTDFTKSFNAEGPSLAARLEHWCDEYTWGILDLIGVSRERPPVVQPPKEVPKARRK